MNIVNFEKLPEIIFAMTVAIMKQNLKKKFLVNIIQYLDSLISVLIIKIAMVILKI